MYRGLFDGTYFSHKFFIKNYLILKFLKGVQDQNIREKSYTILNSTILKLKLEKYKKSIILI